MPCTIAVQRSGLLDHLIKGLTIGYDIVQVGRSASVAPPKWIAATVLVIDLYEKTAMSSRRKTAMDEIMAGSHTWKWFDDRRGMWCNYSVSNNKTIDDAYQAGETSIR